MSTIYVKGKRWCIHFRHQGKEYRRSLKFNARSGKDIINQAVARQVQLQIDLDLQMGKWPEYFMQRQALLFGGFRDEYLTILQKEKHRYRPATVQNYRYCLQRIRTVIPDDMPITAVDRRLVTHDLLPYLHDGYSWETVRTTIIALKAAWNKAMEWGLIQENPFKGINTKPKKRVPVYYTDEEIDIMRQYFSRTDIPAWQHDIVFLILNTGLRREEAVSLVWQSINLKTEFITFAGKGGKEDLVPLNDQAIAILSRRPRSKKSPRVFWEINNAEAFKSAFDRMRERTNLGGNIHQLRKTYACHFMMNGGNIYELKKILRHESIDTLEIYTTLSPEYLKQARNFVGF